MNAEQKIQLSMIDVGRILHDANHTINVAKESYSNFMTLNTYVTIVRVFLVDHFQMHCANYNHTYSVLFL